MGAVAASFFLQLSFFREPGERENPTTTDLLAWPLSWVTLPSYNALQ